MKRALVAMLERTIVDVRDAIEAIEHDQVETALEKFAAISGRVTETARRLRLTNDNEPGGSREEATPGSSTNGG